MLDLLLGKFLSLGLPIIKLILGEIGGVSWLGTIFMVMGILRTIMKPLFSLIHTITEQLPSKNPELEVKKIEQSKLIKVLTYILDWSSSIKLKP